IQINGRPTPSKGTALAAYLKQIPANIGERIEVIPNPSAKYDPEGMAGIIDMVLKANTDLGLRCGVNTRFATPSRFNSGGNVGYPGTTLCHGSTPSSRAPTSFLPKCVTIAHGMKATCCCGANRRILTAPARGLHSREKRTSAMG